MKHVRIARAAMAVVSSLLASLLVLTAGPRAAYAAVSELYSSVNEQNAFAILKVYDPDGWHMVNFEKRRGSAMVSEWLQGNPTNADGLDDVVHEECHKYTIHKSGEFNSKGERILTIYVGGGEEVVVNMGKITNVFPTSEMAEKIPSSLRTFRFDDYVSKGSTLSANIDGAYGLLNEFNAYSWGMSNQLNLFEYYLSQSENPEDLRTFFNQCVNDMQACAEFRYWTLRYLDYAKTNHPKVYNDFLGNQGYVNAYCLTQERFESLISEYFVRIDQITMLAKAYGYEVEEEEDEVGSILWFKNDEDILGTGIRTVYSDYELLMDEIEKPQYQAIEKALHDKATMSKIQLSDANWTEMSAQSYTGSEIRPAILVKKGNTNLRQGTDYNVTFANNVYPGTAMVVIAGRGRYVGGIATGFEIVERDPVEWKRLWGQSSLDTASSIVNEGWQDGCGGTVVVARNDDFKDALAGAGLAGLTGAPIVLTGRNKLADQAAAQLRRLQPSRVYVAGGDGALKPAVVDGIQAATGLEVQPDNSMAETGIIRLWGSASPQTSAALAMAGAGAWADGTAIIATNGSFKDALSAAPISYAKHWPILLASDGAELSGDVIKALGDLGI